MSAAELIADGGARLVVRDMLCVHSAAVAARRAWADWRAAGPAAQRENLHRRALVRTDELLALIADAAERAR